MKRYVALLRGINISGKNKIPMVDLKLAFTKLGYFDVVTYLNSGNVLFSCVHNDTIHLANEIQLMIEQTFGLDIPVFIILQKELEELLQHAPLWWGDENKEIYDNLIFLISPLTSQQFYQTMGEPKAEYEQAYCYQNVIFWSFSRKNYQKTNWWSKTASSDISKQITVRTANTLRKIICL